MDSDYSIQTCKNLEEKFRKCGLHRPMQASRYDNGTELTYSVTPVPADNGAPVQVHLKIIKFVGGGFAGQVYKVDILRIEGGDVNGLRTGGVYAMKILIPPSGFSLFFRNLLYGIGFQGPFQLQVNPVAARSGALWQKFIRTAAGKRFGDENCVNDILATFVDEKLGSCGELSGWVDGRTWRLEVDENMDVLSRWMSGKNTDPGRLGSPEFRSKKKFMKDFVQLLHEMGADEFARQYEWSTCKSQPNCLKRTETDATPEKGLIAVDFRAGLTLIPFLPMSPGDVILILKGLLRGSLVQFDRGNLKKLEAFIKNHSDVFNGMENALEELKVCEINYRNSVPDISHNHFRLLYSPTLWSTMLKSAVTGWKVRNLIDQEHHSRWVRSPLRSLLLAKIGFIPVLGRIFLKFCGHTGWRRHYLSLLNPNYLLKALRGKMLEQLIDWHRAGRLDAEKTERVSNSVFHFMLLLPFSILPVGLHKFITDWSYFKERLDYILARPVRLYFNNALREQWLRDMVEEGKAKHIISEADEKTILSRIKEPFIQKYLKSLAVHVCTVPITQVVSVMIAVIYVLTHPEMPRAQAWGIGLGIIALFQVVPVSPGSATRGLYVLYLVIRERNFKDYNIAVFLGFFKYIGYLAFPIQMTYRYPTLARFMAAHWATEAVHIVPVFGEGGALLEHWIFRLFYNWPLTIRRRVQARLVKRKEMPARYWHVPVVCVLAAALFGLLDYYYVINAGMLPTLKKIGWAVLLIPLFTGSLLTLGARGADMWKRISLSVVAGIFSAVFYSGISWYLTTEYLSTTPVMQDFLIDGAWRIFAFTVFSVIGLILTELKIPDPEIK